MITLLLLATLAHADYNPDIVGNYNLERREFYKSCSEDKLPYYKCHLLWEGRDKACPTGMSFGSMIGMGVAAGAASAVTKKLLK